MIRFEHIEVLLALAAIPLFVGLFVAMRLWRKRALKRFASAPQLALLAPRISRFKPWVKLALFCIAFGFLVVGLANPQTGSKREEVKRKGVDLMICLDVSNSMKAEDLSPNRLGRAKRAIDRFVDNLHGDRVGIIVFAGNAYVQLPITTDYPAAKMFLNTIDTDAVPTQGTAIGEAIELAMQSFDLELPSGKAIIVISDGENHEDDAMQAAATANEVGVMVHTIGLGSPKGSPIPIYRKGRPAGRRTDKDGNTIVTRLNEDMLADIATAGGGTYVRATNAHSGLEDLMAEIDQMEKSDLGSMVFTDYEDRFWIFIAIALGLLILESAISYRRSMWLADLFK